MINRPVVLLTAFRGTSGEKLITCFNDTYRKIILENDKKLSADQLINALESEKTNYIISLGQKPVIKDKIYIELNGKIGGEVYKTNFDMDKLSSCFNMHNFSVRISSNAGTSFCNHIYAVGLKYIFENNYNAEMTFIHVPFEKNTSDFEDFSRRLIGAINYFYSQK